MIKAVLLSLTLCLSLSAHAAQYKHLRIDYEGFTLWMDCEARAAIMFRYNAQHDTGNLKRESAFHLDPHVPAYCQQWSSKPYRAKGKRYDRGHQVPANHLDYSKKAIHQSQFMTNILPQAANMNRGAWYLTEEITECYRDIDELLILGGPIFGDPSNDYFLKSHGIKTPEAFWKVIVRRDRVIAWIIPNTQAATKQRLDDYLVSVSDIQKRIGKIIPIDENLKKIKLDHSWLIPKGCNKG